jgi:hypothetical protein
MYVDRSVCACVCVRLRRTTPLHTHTHYLSLVRACTLCGSVHRRTRRRRSRCRRPCSRPPTWLSAYAPTDAHEHAHAHVHAHARTRTRTRTRTAHTYTLKDTHTYRRFPSLCLSYPRGVVRGGGQARVDMGWVVAGARAELPAAAGVAAEVGLGASPLSVAIDGHVMVRALQLASTLAVAAAARRVRDADAIVCRSMYAYGHLCLCVCLRVSVSVCVCVSLSPHLGVYY